MKYTDSEKKGISCFVLMLTTLLLRIEMDLLEFRPCYFYPYQYQYHHNIFS